MKTISKELKELAEHIRPAREAFAEADKRRGRNPPWRQGDFSARPRMTAHTSNGWPS